MEIVETGDGSQTIYSQQFKQHYHSVFGAKTESDRVFIDLGFEEAARIFGEVRILEVGFGTGLNVYLSLQKAKENKVKTHYTGVEAFPIDKDTFENLIPEVKVLHELDWEAKIQLSEYFIFKKSKAEIQKFETEEKFNIIYFDAFAPESQPEMWTTEVFEKLNKILVPQGILTTYCSKVWVQKNLKQAGFKIEKHKGPPHKREVLRAVKWE